MYMIKNPPFFKTDWKPSIIWNQEVKVEVYIIEPVDVYNGAHGI